jgi:hypothetical protein
VCYAQSSELVEAYNQVVSTLKTYKFQSLEVYEDGGSYAKTRSITLKLQSGKFIISFNDSFEPFSEPIFGNKQGTKTIKIPIDKVKIEIGRWNENKIVISSEDGVEFIYKGKKELLEEYAICGEKLSCKKLIGELKDMLSLAQDEDFQGALGVVSSTKKNQSRKNTPTTKKPSTTKSAGKYVQ